MINDALTTPVELFRALAVFCESSQPPLVITDALGLERPSIEDHTDLFVVNLLPYGSIYLSEDAMLGGEPRDRLVGLLSTLGLRSQHEPDHLGGLLGLYARLREEQETVAADAQSYVVLSKAADVLLWEYLLSWAPLYLRKVGEIGPPIYRRWAALLSQALEAEADRHIPISRYALPPTMQGRLYDEDGFRRLLAPAVSGLIVSMADLRRCARDLGLGLRVGERWYALKSLLAQGSPDVQSWLRTFAQDALEDLGAEGVRSQQSIYGPMFERISLTCAWLGAFAPAAGVTSGDRGRS